MRLGGRVALDRQDGLAVRLAIALALVGRDGDRVRCVSHLGSATALRTSPAQGGEVDGVSVDDFRRDKDFCRLARAERIRRRRVVGLGLVVGFVVAAEINLLELPMLLVDLPACADVDEEGEQDHNPEKG